ncbi:MAG: uncharacterized protein KVP18_000336 [Porospora cf. gigantea A]|uniref:uncharacterized protein n=1 Tax=Porospora cf. gigantea A TaxID=2853593 RepID=UPI00355A14FC|nr:MAG: hypothetical protein KVP18_000336 [Porospora cf. gigantea A]
MLVGILLSGLAAGQTTKYNKIEVLWDQACLGNLADVDFHAGVEAMTGSTGYTPLLNLTSGSLQNFTAHVSNSRAAKHYSTKRQHILGTDPITLDFNRDRIVAAAMMTSGKTPLDTPDYFPHIVADTFTFSESLTAALELAPCVSHVEVNRATVRKPEGGFDSFDQVLAAYHIQSDMTTATTSPQSNEPPFEYPVVTPESAEYKAVPFNWRTGMKAYGKNSLASLAWYMGGTNEFSLVDHPFYNVGMDWVEVHKRMKNVWSHGVEKIFAPSGLCRFDARDCGGADEDRDRNGRENDCYGFADGDKGFIYDENAPNVEGSDHHPSCLASLVAADPERSALPYTCKACAVYSEMTHDTSKQRLDFLLAYKDRFKVSVIDLRHDQNYYSQQEVTRRIVAGNDHVMVMCQNDAKDSFCYIDDYSCLLNRDAVPIYPALFPFVNNRIIAGVTDATGNMYQNTPRGAQTTHVFAPGVGIPYMFAHRYPTEKSYYDRLWVTDTCAGAAQVAAAIANAWSYFPDFPGHEIHQAVMDAAPLGNMNNNDAHGGILNADMLFRIFETSGQVPSTEPVPDIDGRYTPSWMNGSELMASLGTTLSLILFLV